MITAKLVQRMLVRTASYHVDLAEDGRRGLELILDNHYDILLIDNDMPLLDGFELLRELQRRDIDAPAIMITGAGDEKTAVSALKTGCKDYIIKDGDGSFLHLLPAVISQVLNQKRSEALLEAKNLENQRLLQELQEANQRLEKINNLKNEVMGIATHDLRSPLSAILGAVSLLADDESMSPSQKEILTICINAGEQAINMIDGLLDPTNLDSGEITLQQIEADLAIIVLESAAIHQDAAHAKDIELCLECDKNVLGIVDVFRLRELVDNLLSNAIKYSPRGKSIWLKTCLRDHSPCIVVRDEGPGFSEEDRHLLYQRYQRLSAQPTGNEASTGLGLSIVKRIVELHDAEIELVSAPGEGAEFIVTFPPLPGLATELSGSNQSPTLS